MQNNIKFLTFYSYFCLSLSVLFLIIAGNIIIRSGSVFFAVFSLIIGACGFFLSLHINKREIWAYKAFIWLVILAPIALISSNIISPSNVRLSEPFGALVIILFVVFVLTSLSLVAIGKLKSINQASINEGVVSQEIIETEEPLKIKFISILYIVLLTILDILYVLYALLVMSKISSANPYSFGISVAFGSMLLTILYFLLSITFAFLLNFRIKNLNNLLFNTKFCIKATFINCALYFIVSSLLLIIYSSSKLSLILESSFLLSIPQALIGSLILNAPFFILRSYKSK